MKHQMLRHQADELLFLGQIRHTGGEQIRGAPEYQRIL